MSAHHGHGHSAQAGDVTFVASRRSVVILSSIVIPILLATAVALVLLWPHGKPSVALPTTAAAAAGDVSSARVLSTSSTTCAGDSSDRLPDGSIPAKAICASVVARLGSGADSGQKVTVAVPPQVFRSGISPGDRIDLIAYPAQATGQSDGVAAAGASRSGKIYTWVDFSRGLPLGLLAVAFAVLVVGVARLRGLAAILGLAIAYLAIIRFMLPALRLGENAIAVALVGSIAVMTVVLYLAHGISAKTTTALLGTFFGLVLSAGIAGWATSAAHLNGLSSQDNATISQITGSSDLSGIILCGIIVAGLGVLNDVTITQASAVWEVYAYAPHLRVGELFVSGMRVGRDHLASTVYTIAFAYAGAALPTLILIDLYQRPLGQVITSGQIAEEIVRTLVGSIGLVLAIPVTTAVAAVIVASGRVRGAQPPKTPADDAVVLPDDPPVTSSPRLHGRRAAF